jgi:hypothetical protein
LPGKHAGRIGERLAGVERQRQSQADGVGLRFRGRLELFGCMDVRLAERLGERWENGFGSAAQQDQTRTLRGDRGGERAERLVQPPAGCRADPPRARRLVVQHEHGSHRPGVHGGQQRAVIGQPQIVTEPEYLSFRHWHVIHTAEAGAAMGAGVCRGLPM